ncbi:hypothetical protein PUW92_02880 [Metamycoplasma hyosynoviae]|nr:hypothetical protein [Metamycoplasma hyosynoviae]MDD7898324.1 hypothetical protein [Metamycoplasma hyosynoviae]
MKEEIEKLKLNISDFKTEYWYSKTIEIPQFIKNIEPDITEDQLFNKLLLNVYQTCDLFINQKMSQFLSLDITLEQIKDILGKQRVKNFISSIYTEIKYRLATEKFPEFSQKDKLITSNFSVASAGREFSNFQSLLSPESIAYLTYPTWNDLKIANKDDYLNIIPVLEKLNQFDNRIEKLLNDNSQSDENLKLSFSKFKSDQLESNTNLENKINDLNIKKEEKLPEKIKKFLTRNITSEELLGSSIAEDGIIINFGQEAPSITVKSEYFYSDINPGNITLAAPGEGSEEITIDNENITFSDEINNVKIKEQLNLSKLKSLYANLDKTKDLENKINSFTQTLERLNQFDNRIEKLLNDNSQSDENLKLSFSKFKSDQEVQNNAFNNKIDILNKANATIKNIDNELTALKQKDIDILKVLINFVNKLIKNNEKNLNVDFIKADYEKLPNEPELKIGDIVDYKGKKIYILDIIWEEITDTQGNYESAIYYYKYMTLEESEELRK